MGGESGTTEFRDRSWSILKLNEVMSEFDSSGGVVGIDSR